MAPIIRRPKAWLAAVLAFLLFVTACSAPKTASRWEQTPTDTATQVDRSAIIQGGQFNAFFPTEGNGFERIYTQEKRGFAEAKLKQNGTDLAMLSVSDTASNPQAAEKYFASDSAIAGYPATSIGSTATGVLVGDRLQVKVLSRSETFSASDREQWIEKFDLDGLAQLANNS
ncbi:MAG: hypothetical protein AAFY57_03390 [Cyanobacteria bacterium J06642_2]